MYNIKSLKKLVSIKSYESGDEIVNFLKEYFTKKVKEIKVIENEFKKKSILIGINTELRSIEPILLSGHIDTVFADIKKYNTNPYELTIKDGKAYGLGVIDMKCFTATIMDKFEQLKNIPWPIIVALTTDEETTFTCVKDIVKELIDLNIRPKFTIVGEPTNFEIKTTSNGCFEYQIEVFGKSCHSSLISEGINAINIIAKLITFIEKEQEKFENLTSNVGIVIGGDIVNRVPDYTKMEFDIRTSSLGEYDRFLAVIKEKIKVLQSEYNAKIVLTKNLEILPLQCIDKKNIENISKKFDLKVGKFPGGCEAGYYENLNSPTIVFGVGNLELAHKPNEFIVVDDYIKYNNLLLQVINEIIKIYY